MGETNDGDLSGYPAPMELATTRRSPGDLPAELVEVMADYARRGRADNTWRAYESDLRHFAAWCELKASGPAWRPGHHRGLPGRHATVFQLSTLRRRLAAISVMHQAAGYTKANSPTAAAEVRAVWSGIRRAHGAAPQKVRAARTKVINAVVAQLGSKPIDVRDRALLLIGFAGALRRSELVALDVADITEDDQGLQLVLRRSKTDQEGETKTLGLPYGSNPVTCPVRAWRAWRQLAEADTGPAFQSITRHDRINDRRLSDRGVADMIGTPGPGSWPRRPFRRAFAALGLCYRGLRPGHAGTRHHASRPLALGRRHAWLRRRRRHLERQRRSEVGAVGLGETPTDYDLRNTTSLGPARRTVTLAGPCLLTVKSTLASRIQ